MMTNFTLYFLCQGLIKHCIPCKLSFLNSNAFGQHMNFSHHKKPNRSSVAKCAKKQYSWNRDLSRKPKRGTSGLVVRCKGCGQVFKTQIVGKQPRPSAEYYIHCTERCKEYKNLNLIRECGPCNRKFVDVGSYRRHRISFHAAMKTVNASHAASTTCTSKQKKDLNEVATDVQCKKRCDNPEEVPQLSTFTTSGGQMPPVQFNTVVYCIACHKKFKANEINGSVNPEVDYYYHCIVECVKYKDLELIRQCAVCGKKFMDKNGLKEHIDRVH